MPPHDAPEPDIVLTSAADGSGLIPVQSVKLIIEVADSTLSTDAGRKLALYAGRGIEEYLIVDLHARIIHQMFNPAGEHYIERGETPFGEPIVARTIAALGVETDSL